MTPTWPTLTDVMAAHARSFPQRAATVDGEVRLTYPQLDARVRRLAGALASAGVGSGDRVLWLGQNSWRLLELLLAAGHLGAACCPVNWRQSAEELAFVIDDVSPGLAIWQEEEIGDTVRAARRLAPGPSTWLCHDRGEYEAFLQGGASRGEAAASQAEDAVLLVYTAAWSGRPNAAMLSHRALIVQGLVMASMTGTDASTVYLGSGPLFHLGTLMFLFATLVAGGTNVFLRRVEAEELCKMIERERCTGAYIVGPTVEQVLEVNRDARYDLSSLRWPAGRPAWDAMVSPDLTPWGRHPGGYGQTETAGMLTFNALGVAGEGTHGRPSPVAQVRIVDGDGAEAPVGEVGEIVARGPTVMNGYWNRPEDTAHRQRGGWHHTNDLGRLERDGTITFIGPRTRMIKSAAENIYPAEVERVIATHPAVAECAVIGVPDDRWVQRVVAVVVARPGAAITADEVIAQCVERLASYKKPRAVEFVDALPRAGVAVDYDALDTRFGGGGYPGGANRIV